MLEESTHKSIYYLGVADIADTSALQGPNLSIPSYPVMCNLSEAVAWISW